MGMASWPMFLWDPVKSPIHLEALHAALHGWGPLWLLMENFQCTTQRCPPPPKGCKFESCIPWGGHLWVVQWTFSINNHIAPSHGVLHEVLQDILDSIGHELTNWLWEWLHDFNVLQPLLVGPICISWRGHVKLCKETFPSTLCPNPLSASKHARLYWE